MKQKIVRVIVDRPKGTRHPKFPELVYPVNYGYVPGVLAGDGEEQDAYILGEDSPLTEFTGRLIAIIRRKNDVEDKWVVAGDNACFSAEEIRKSVDFQEKFFDSTIILLRK